MKVNYWCGDLNSYQDYEAKLAKAEEFKAANGEEDSLELPELYERQGSVGIVKVSGSLIPGEAGFLRYFGITGYEDVKNAAMQAVQDKEAKSILLYVQSPGGSVNGVSATGQVLRMMASLKPTTGYADLAASAGYWLFSTASSLFADSTAIVGSIGVLKVHREFSAYHEKEGIKYTVMRAGRFKALVNPYEPLTEEAKAETQAMLDDLYEDFVKEVANYRGTTPTLVEQNMAQGREFMGRRAMEVGLVDQVGDLDSAISFAAKNQRLMRFGSSNFGASATSAVVGESVLAHNAQNNCESLSDMKKKPVTPEQLAAAIAAGVPVADVQAAQPVVAGGTGTEDESTSEGQTADQQAETASAASSPSEPADLVAFLKQSNEDTNRKLFASETACESLRAENTTLLAAQTQLMTIVQDAVANMSVALGKSAPKDLSVEDLVSTHAALATSFKESFKPGKATASTASVQEPVVSKTTAEASNLALDPLFIYAIKQAPKK